MKYQKSQIYFFISLFLIVLVLAFFILRPYLGALILSATFAIIFTPLHKKILNFFEKHIKWKKGRVSKIMAALLTFIIFIIILLAPLTLLGIQLVSEIRSLYDKISIEENFKFISQTLDYIETQVGFIIPDFSSNFSSYLEQALQWFAQNIGSFFQGVGSLLLGVFLSLLAFYYLLKDGHKLKNLFIKISPLPDKDDKKILEKMKAAVNSVIRGSLAIAIIQGILTGLGFAIFGVPNPTLWGSLAAIAALIPTVGTALVLIPGILYLFFTGELYSGFGLLIWGIAAVGLVDNFLGPHLMKRGVRIHPFLILLSVLGGLSFFGPMGFLVGPLVISLLYALLDIYSEVIKPFKKS
jgi:predicted PurR-regulated permease PerM